MGGTVLKAPNLKYYVRENRDDTNLSSALTYTDAVDYARRFSITNDSGLAEVVGLDLKVIGIVRRGKLLVTGKLAQFISERRTFPAP